MLKENESCQHSKKTLKSVLCFPETTVDTVMCRHQTSWPIGIRDVLGLKSEHRLC